MRILQVTTFAAHPQLGGLESVVYNLSKKLAERKHEVVILMPAKISRGMEVEGFKIVNVDSHMFNYRLIIPRFRSLRTIVELLAWADLVHVHSPHNSFAQTVSLLAKISGKPLIISVFSYLGMIRHPNLTGKIAGLLVESSASMSMMIANAVHVKNVEDCARTKKVNRKVAFIPDGISNDVLIARICAKVFKQKWKLDGAYPIILFVGRIHYLKGPQVGIRAMPLILRKYPLAKLLLVGSDREGYSKYLKKLCSDLGVEDNVVFVGTLSEEDKISALDTADVVTVPSLADVVEAFSLSASEAWARGKPVLASAVGALKYRVKDGTNGYLTIPGSPTSFAENMEKCLTLKMLKLPHDVKNWDTIASVFDGFYRDIWNSR